MDQGDYIDLIVNNVLSNLIMGAVLAIIVLAIFLRSVKPTIVVAFSIPLSVLVAIVLMYFSGVTLNLISLSGLALGIGMLVDNSIVVIEIFTVCVDWVYHLRERRSWEQNRCWCHCIFYTDDHLCIFADYLCEWSGAGTVCGSGTDHCI